MADDGANDDGRITLYLIDITTITTHKWPRDLLVLEEKIYTAVMKYNVILKAFNSDFVGIIK